MSQSISSGKHHEEEYAWFKRQFRKTMEFLYQNGKPTLSLQFVLNRYIQKHGDQGRKTLLNSFGWSDERLDRYLDGEVPSVKNYKTLIKLCIILKLGYEDAWQLMINCGYPPNGLDRDINKRAHYSILKHLDWYDTIEDWNSFLRDMKCKTLDE